MKHVWKFRELWNPVANVEEWYFECVMFVLSQFVGIIFDTNFK